MNFKKMFIALIAGITMFSADSVTNVSATWTDSYFTCPSVYEKSMLVDCEGSFRLAYQSKNPDIYGYGPLSMVEHYSRRKDTSTSIYVKVTSVEDLHDANVSSRVSVRVYGITATAHNNMASKIDTTKFENCTWRGNSVSIPADGGSYLITNSVYENGYSHVLLGMKPSNGSGSESIEGLWSPDSIGYYTTF